MLGATHAETLVVNLHFFTHYQLVIESDTRFPSCAVPNGMGRPNRPPPDSPVSLTGASPRNGPRRSASDAARAAAAAAAAGQHQS